MENIFHHLCWTCNTQQEKLISIYADQIKDIKISHMLEYCTQKPYKSLNKLNETHTAMICYNCLKCLEISYNFLQRFNQAQKEIQIVQDCIQKTKIEEQEQQQQKVNDYEEENVEYICTEEDDDILKEFEICRNKSLKRHRKKEELSDDKERLTCRLCKKSFLTGKALNLHTKIYHKNSMPNNLL